MIKISISKFLTKIILFVLLLLPCFAQKSFAEDIKVISLAPAITEIIYALDAQQNLLGVTTECNYPQEAKKIKKIGNSYFINKELILKLQPSYIFALSSTKALLGGLNNSKMNIVYFDFKNVDSIYQSINKIGNILGRKTQAKNLVKELKIKNNSFHTKSPKRILYLVQNNPYITIGKKSYISELINLSGNISVTNNLNYSYPTITAEFIVKTSPDIIILSFPTDVSAIKKLCPKTKIIILDKNIRDIINRPGIRIYKGVEYFSKI